MLIDMQFNVIDFNKPEVFKNFKKALFESMVEDLVKRTITPPTESPLLLIDSINDFFNKYFLDK